MAKFIGDECVRGCWVAQPAILAENGEPCEKHGGVACECCAEVCSEAILAYAWVASGSEEIVAQTGLDHPPAEEALETDEGRDAEQGCRRTGGHAPPGDEVD